MGNIHTVNGKYRRQDLSRFLSVLITPCAWTDLGPSQLSWLDSPLPRPYTLNPTPFSTALARLTSPCADALRISMASSGAARVDQTRGPTEHIVIAPIGSLPLLGVNACVGDRGVAIKRRA